MADPSAVALEMALAEIARLRAEADTLRADLAGADRTISRLARIQLAGPGSLPPLPPSMNTMSTTCEAVKPREPVPPKPPPERAPLGARAILARTPIPETETAMRKFFEVEDELRANLQADPETAKTYADDPTEGRSAGPQ